MSVLHIDFETTSSLDLRKVGADVYSRDPNLIVTVIAWAFDGGPVQSMTCPRVLPFEVLNHLVYGGEFRAWNASFEWAILVNHFKLALDPAQAVCTMQKALHSGLPASLEDAGPAIGAKQHKDASARRLMLQLSKPRKNRGRPDSYWHMDDPHKLLDLQAYCEQDVMAERDIDSMIADLPMNEQRISIMDRRANNRGVRLDLRFVAALKALALDETKTLNLECQGLTRGAVTSPGTQTAKLLDWFKRNGLPATNLGKEEVALWLNRNAFDLTLAWNSSAVYRVLEIRQEIAKSSLKKLDAMARCAGPGDRVRGQLAYYGAFRTGRFAGRLVQPQNFPRPHGDVKGFTRYMLQSIARGGADADFVRVVWGNPLDAVARALRGCLVPSPGKVFVVRDLSQIEARVIAWLAGQQDILDVFERNNRGQGEDVYVYTQKKLGLPNRQAGKVVVLGLGFGMGPAHFVDYAASQGVTITLAESMDMVREWRLANRNIYDFWYRLDDVAKDVLRAWRARAVLAGHWVGGASAITRQATRGIAFTVSKARNGTCLLTMLLPSGRRLYYRNARLAPDPNHAGRESIIYEGVDTYTKKWTDIRTWGSKLAENCVQATARDVIIEAGLRIDNQNLGDLVLSVHDELVFEVDEKDAIAREQFIQAEIDARPTWAADLPVASEGSILRRYGK